MCSKPELVLEYVGLVSTRGERRTPDSDFNGENVEISIQFAPVAVEGDASRLAVSVYSSVKTNELTMAASFLLGYHDVFTVWEGMSSDEQQGVIQDVCFPQVFPYLREHYQHLSMSLGQSPVILPPISADDLNIEEDGQA